MKVQIVHTGWYCSQRGKGCSCSRSLPNTVFSFCRTHDLYFPTEPSLKRNVSLQYLWYVDYFFVFSSQMKCNWSSFNPWVLWEEGVIQLQYCKCWSWSLEVNNRFLSRVIVRQRVHIGTWSISDCISLLELTICGDPLLCLACLRA